MAKRGRPKKGQQLDLIDVAPENLKEIIPVAREYRELVKARLNILKQEVEFKQKLLQLAQKAGLTADAKGKIKFKADGMTIIITPQDYKVQVKEDAPKE